ncbi:MAG: sulfurtransferase TusA family protein [Thermodesulfovibrionales bacterium]
MATDVKYDRELDVTGLVCPRPMVMSMSNLKAMSSGQVLKIIANDSSTKHSLPALCERAGYKLLEQQEESGSFIFIIQK